MQNRCSQFNAISRRLPYCQVPREFRELAGTSAEIYQTSYADGIVFLVKDHHLLGVPCVVTQAADSKVVVTPAGYLMVRRPTVVRQR